MTVGNSVFGYNKTELIDKEYLTATWKLQPKLYSEKLLEYNFGENCVSLS